MGRKRKSEMISQSDEIDIVDLTTAYGFEDDISSIPALPAPESNKRSRDPPDDTNGRAEPSNLQATLDFASAVTHAAKIMNNSSRLMHFRLSQSAPPFSKGCKQCQDVGLKCDLQRPACTRCQPLVTFGKNGVPCSYPPNLADSLRISATSSQQHNVEVIDLGSDDDELASDREYEVESILKRRWRHGIQYLVRWKGFPEDDNTREPESNLEGAKTLIDQFEATEARTTSKEHRERYGSPAVYAYNEAKKSSHGNEIIIPPSREGRLSQPSRRIPCQYEYLVQWNGLGQGQNSWEPENRFANAKQLVMNYQTTAAVYLPDVKVDVSAGQALTGQELSAGTQVIICSRRNAEALGEFRFCTYHRIQRTHSWLSSSDLVTEKARMAVMLFSEGSKIMQEASERRRNIQSPPPLQAVPRLTPTTRQIQEVTTSTEVGVEFSTLREVSLSNTAPKNAAIITHRLRNGQSTEYLARWTDSSTYTWLSTEELSGFAEGIPVAKAYQADTERRFGRQRISKVLSTDEVGRASLRGQLAIAAHSTASNSSHLGGLHASARKDLMQPLSQSLSNSYTTPRSSNHNKQPRPLTSPSKDSMAASKAAVIAYRLDTGVPAKRSGLDTETSIASILRRQALDGRTSRMLHACNGLRQLKKEEEDWVEKSVNQTAALLTGEEMTRIARRVTDQSAQLSEPSKVFVVQSHLRALALRHLNSALGRFQKPQSTHNTALQERQPRADPSISNDLNAGSGPAKGGEWYPVSDAFILVGKKDSLMRPLPKGRYNQHNVASNVLLTIGKHPWLPGLNHHLQGQLDRDQSGRQINVVSKQMLRAQELKTYTASMTMSEIKVANDLAALPMGGTPLRA